jgi:hypothetical protein
VGIRYEDTTKIRLVKSSTSPKTQGSAQSRFPETLRYPLKLIWLYRITGRQCGMLSLGRSVRSPVILSEHRLAGLMECGPPRRAAAFLRGKLASNSGLSKLEAEERQQAAALQSAAAVESRPSDLDSQLVAPD